MPTQPGAAVTQAALLAPLKSASVGGHPLSRETARGEGMSAQTPKHSIQLRPATLNPCLRFSGFKQNKNLIHHFQAYRKRKSFIFLPLKKKKKRIKPQKKKNKTLWLRESSECVSFHTTPNTVQDKSCRRKPKVKDRRK